MAFRTVTPEVADKFNSVAAGRMRALRKAHMDSVADLLKLAETPADANTALAAVAGWRDEQKRRDQYWRKEALMQVMSGDRPEDVCAGLGFGRTALQAAVRAEGSELATFAPFVYRTRPKQKKRVS
ncbi:hypothetical protein ACP6C7_04015 [Mycolicibacterium septicum]|uniref:Uncharacterized protein n=1 Tax=Mycolicibacterium septicum TaxID=98668 RepID=A0ABW9LQP0_9MYCO